MDTKLSGTDREAAFQRAGIQSATWWDKIRLAKLAIEVSPFSWQLRVYQGYRNFYLMVGPIRFRLTR